MAKALYILVILTLTRCMNSGGNYDSVVPKSVEVKYHDPRLGPLFDAVKKVDRDSMGFEPLDSNAIISYKEEFQRTLIKLFFEKSDYITILYFGRSNKGIVYQNEDETIKGPRKMFIKDVDGYKTEIQETITRSFETSKENNFGKRLRITFLDLDKYPDKRPYNQDSSEFHVFMDEEISIEQAKEVIARWKPGK